MTNELSKERAIEALYTVRAYYASLTAGYPKGKDCRGIGDVMCSEIANSCLMAIKALEQQPCEDCVSREQALDAIDTWDKFGYTEKGCFVRNPKGDYVPYVHYDDMVKCIKNLPSVTPHQKTGHWVLDETDNSITCDKCGCLIWADDITNGEAYYCPNCGAEMEVQNDE